MLPNYHSYGIGLSNSHIMGGARSGMYTPETAYMGFLDGSLRGEEVIKDNGQVEFEEEKVEPKPKTPILTYHGKIVFIVVVLGFAAYCLYQKHKASKANDPTPQPDQIETQTQIVEPQPTQPQGAEGGEPNAEI